jgi:hypothetical protein
MTEAARLNDMLLLAGMRRRLAQLKLQKSAEAERRRAEIAEDGRARQREAEKVAEAYIDSRFASADLSVGAAGFFESLALGHRHAEREAIALATRAERLSERHLEAVDERARAARHLLRSEQRLSQHNQLADDILGRLRAEEDEAEEEESQEVRAGRRHDGPS